MNRLEELFAKKKKNILSVFYTAGFPAFESTVSIAQNLEADFMEIGIPFSDPVADGPVIQESNSIALNNGMTLVKLLEQVRQIRETVSVPIVLMGYLNPVMQYGVENFCRDASQAGADGVILPDLPAAEYEKNYRALFSACHLSFPLLISPTTSD
ncbi:MAG: tryptophan synthase subunit alpha, partial [Candidatus Nephrothrix sp. EaCA]